MQMVLADLGVGEDTLSEAEKRSLDEQGDVVLKEMFTLAQAATFRLRLEELAAQEGEEAGKEAHQEKGLSAWPT